MSSPHPSDQVELNPVFQSSDVFGATLLHHVVFATVAFQTVPFDILAHNAMMRRPEPLPLTVWERTVRECIEKRWLRSLDDAALLEIASCLTGVELVCENEERSLPGEIDFTAFGAQVYKARLSTFPELKLSLDAAGVRRTPGTEPNCTGVECYSLRPITVQEALYSTGDGWAFELAERPVLSVTEPEIVGPWCRRWWHQHSSGYRFKATIAT
jgi:hypothetical protein